MGLYSRYVLPRLLAAAMKAPQLTPFRDRIGRVAQGRVLELGVGAGQNFGFYRDGVTSLVGIDPSPQLLERAAENGRSRGFEISLIAAPAECLPVDSASIDTVVSTWTLCSVADMAATLAEARRVLRPGGRLLFAEHGLAPDAKVARRQRLITPVWRRLAGGCHADRAIEAAVLAAGFEMVQIETGYLGFPRTLTFMYLGCARVG